MDNNMNESQYQDQPQMQYQDQPQMQYQDQPQMQYQGQPQMQYQDQPQMQYQGQPQMQYQDQPQMQYQGQPQMQYQNQFQSQFGQKRTSATAKDIIKYVIVLVANLCAIGFMFLPQITMGNSIGTSKSGYFVKSFEYFVELIKVNAKRAVVVDKNIVYIINIAIYVSILILPCFALLKNLIVSIRALIGIASKRCRAKYPFKSLKTGIGQHLSLIVVFAWYPLVEEFGIMDGYGAVDNISLGIGWWLTIITYLVGIIAVIIIDRTTKNANEKKAGVGLSICNGIFASVFLGLTFAIVCLFIGSLVENERGFVGIASIVALFVKWIESIIDGRVKYISDEAIYGVPILFMSAMILFNLNSGYVKSCLTSLKKNKFSGLGTMLVGIVNLVFLCGMYLGYLIIVDDGFTLDAVNGFDILIAVTGVLEFIFGIVYVVIKASVGNADTSSNMAYNQTNNMVSNMQMNPNGYVYMQNNQNMDNQYENNQYENNQYENNQYENNEYVENQFMQQDVQMNNQINNEHPY